MKIVLAVMLSVLAGCAGMTPEQLQQLANSMSQASQQATQQSMESKKRSGGPVVCTKNGDVTTCM